ncbi:MAG: VWA domain-containing protein, partial [Desulfobulbaceae bacterium]|nr:VWA domain-containing protein [Desulfobulbaceae bacterium]
MNLPFTQPFWLIVGIIVCIIAFVFLRISAARRRRVLTEFAAPETCDRLTINVSGTRRTMKDILVLAALASCFVALARPQYGEEWREVRQKGIDILIAVDTSRSMLTPDIQPNRLERAKLAIKDFVGRLEGDRVGLMPFAGSSFLMCPLTTDYGAFTASLDALGPDSIPFGGTDLAGVINAAGALLSNEANHKILILVTDGEDLKGEALQAAKKAAAQNMTIYTIGVGTPEGELIPDMKSGGKTYIKDASGNFVRSKLDAITLTKIAKITGGLYVPLGSMGQGFATIYQEKLKLIPKEEHNERMQRHPIERFYWPLALAIVLLALDFLISGRKSTRSFGIPLIKTAGRRLFNRGKLLIVFTVLLSGLTGNANGSTGDELYRQKKFDQAEKAYAQILEKEPGDAILHFNLGDVQYKKKAYEKAISSYTKALQDDDLKLQAKSYYNRGNAGYQLGKTHLKTDPEQTMKLYRQAIADYEGSLALTPNDTDAAYNRDLVQKQLDELEKQQQEKKKQEQKSQQNKKDKKDKKNQDKQESGEGEKDKPKQQNSEKKNKNKNKKNQPEKNKGDQSQQQESQSGSDQASKDKKASEKPADTDKNKSKPEND